MRYEIHGPSRKGVLRQSLIVVWLCFVTVTGCMVGPNFQRPQEPVPARWSGPLPPPPPQPATLVEKELACFREKTADERQRLREMTPIKLDAEGWERFVPK